MENQVNQQGQGQGIAARLGAWWASQAISDETDARHAAAAATAARQVMTNTPRQVVPMQTQTQAPVQAYQQSQTQMQAAQCTLRYQGEKAMLDGIARMQQQGWRVQGQTSYQPRAGCMRVITLGFLGAAVFKPKAVFVVTFTR